MDGRVVRADEDLIQNLALTMTDQYDIVSADGEMLLPAEVMQMVKVVKDKKPTSPKIIQQRLDDMLESGKKVHPMAMMRMSAGITQAQLAERAGLAQTQIGRVENWDRDIGCMSVRNAYKIASALGCRIEDLLGMPRLNSPKKKVQ
jgi:DNA-binding XRE family transcriptional regulator